MSYDSRKVAASPSGGSTSCFHLNSRLQLLRGHTLRKSNSMQGSLERKAVVGGSTIRVGRFTYGHENISVRQWGEGACLTIGSFCSIANSVKIFLGGNHRLDWITTYPFGHIFVEDLIDEKITGHPKTNGDVIIGDDVWVGEGATIMSGVNVGSGSVVAANSHVVKSVNPYEVVGGNPARHIKYRFEKRIIELLLDLSWWRLPIEKIRIIAPALCAQPNEKYLRELISRFSGG